MTNLITTMTETYVNNTELFNNRPTLSDKDGWYQADSMTFLRKMKLQQEIRFLEYWIPRQERRLDKQKGWVSHWARRRSGTPELGTHDEITENNYQASLAQAKADQYNVEFLQTQLDDAQLAYQAENEEVYTTVTNSNIAPDGAPSEIDAETAQDLASLGITL
jgi:DNA-dependent RNA polymerase auxiliary subunit epsilon